MTSESAVVSPSKRAVNKFIEDFDKQFGEGALKVGRGDDLTYVSTGSLALDRALGNGLVLGRLTEIWGPGEVGKTTLAMCIVAEHQRRFPERLVGWINIERTFNMEWAVAHGMEKSRVHRVDPEDAQQAADMAAKMVKSGLFSVIVIDSIGGMIGKSEMTKDADQAVVAEVAKVITRMVKQQSMLADDNGTSIILINQVRTAGIGTGKTWDATGGGHALMHVTTHKIRLRRTGEKPYVVGTGDNAIEVGFEVAAQVQRNKVAVPKKVANYFLINQDTEEFGELGIDQVTEAYTMGLLYGVITKQMTANGAREGNMHVLPDREKPVNGRPKVLQALRESPDLLAMVQKGIVAAVAPVDVADRPEEVAHLNPNVQVEESDFETGAPLPSQAVMDSVMDAARAKAQQAREASNQMVAG